MGNITSSSSFTDYRWLKPIQDPHGRDYYTPLPLNRMLTIESKYKKYQHHEITQSEKTKYNFDFDSETLKENEVINYRKKLPIEDLNIYRYLRNSRNPFQQIKPEKRNSLEDLRVFYFSSLFAHCQIDYKDNFVYIKLSGACAHCGYQDMTIKDGIEEMIINEIPEVKEVRNISNN